MTIQTNLTAKEIALGLFLHVYIGGFAFFWGASTNDPYLMIVFAFLVTQMISGRITFNVILKNHWQYRLQNRYARLLINFGVNVVIANLLMPLLVMMHPGDLAEFLEGPVIYGVMYGILYSLYFISMLKPVVTTDSQYRRGFQ